MLRKEDDIKNALDGCFGACGTCVKGKFVIQLLSNRSDIKYSQTETSTLKFPLVLLLHEGDAIRNNLT